MGGWLSPSSTVGRLLWPIMRHAVENFHHQLCMSVISLKDAVRPGACASGRLLVMSQA